MGTESAVSHVAIDHTLLQISTSLHRSVHNNNGTSQCKNKNQGEWPCKGEWLYKGEWPKSSVEVEL